MTDSATLYREKEKAWTAINKDLQLIKMVFPGARMIGKVITFIHDACDQNWSNFPVQVLEDIRKSLQAGVGLVTAGERSVHYIVRNLVRPLPCQFRAA